MIHAKCRPRADRAVSHAALRCFVIVRRCLYLPVLFTSWGGLVLLVVTVRHRSEDRRSSVVGGVVVGVVVVVLVGVVVVAIEIVAIVVEFTQKRFRELLPVSVFAYR